MKGIYKITSPNGNIYIGQSSNIEKRIKLYRRCACKGQRKLYNSLKKYGWDAHKFEILEEIEDKELLHIQEKYYYDLFSKENEMLNIQIPGGKGNNFVAEETKKILSEKASKQKVTQFDKNGIFIKIWNSIADISKNLNINRTTISSNLNGKTKFCKGFIFAKGEKAENIIVEYKRNYNSLNRRKSGYNMKGLKIGQYDLEGNFIKQWDAMSIAAKELDLNERCISSVCRGITKQTGGFIWKYIK